MLAVCGLYAIDNNIARLKEDHEKARVLADGIRSIPALELAPSTVPTNILFFNVKSTKFSRDQFVEKMAEHGVRFSTNELSDHCRAITHLDVSLEVWAYV